MKHQPLLYSSFSGFHLEAANPGLCIAMRSSSRNATGARTTLVGEGNAVLMGVAADGIEAPVVAGMD
jgi:hypothetical protein